MLCALSSNGMNNNNGLTNEANKKENSYGEFPLHIILHSRPEGNLKSSFQGVKIAGKIKATLHML